DGADLAAGPDELAGRVLGGGESQPEQVLTAAIEELQGRLATVLERVRQVDLAMAGPVERSRSKVVEELDKLRQKMRNSRQNRQGTGLRQIRRLCSNLRPRGRLQERVLNVLPFLIAHGEGLADALIDAADPFGEAHGVVEL